MRVAVVMGGPSAEYEISILTGVEMIRHLTGGKNDVRAVVMGAGREFYYADIGTPPPDAAPFADPASSGRLAGPYAPGSAADVWKGVDVALLGLHGAYGEDGRFQGYLETLGIPYTGSGVLASAIGMDKIATKLILLQHGIATPPFSLYGRGHPDTTPATIAAHHGFPCFVKCPQSGSSKLMGRAADAGELRRLLKELAPEADTLLVETAVSGIELSCPVLEYPDGTVRPLLPVEIRPVKSSYFDYTAKYTDGACEEMVPAPQPAELLERVQATAERVHRVLGCRGVTRTDVIVKGDLVSVLEINTLPGFTTASLVPKSFAAAGGTYGQLLDILVQGALARGRRGA